jgi:hypothetical protein
MHSVIHVPKMTLISDFDFTFTLLDGVAGSIISPGLPVVRFLKLSPNSSLTASVKELSTVLA